MAIYTKRGDRGKTSLLKSKRQVRKDSQRITAVGALDELNSSLGLAASLVRDTDTDGVLVDIQQDLFEIAAEIATPNLKDSLFKCGPDKTRRLEVLIDELEGRLPVLSNFIFPGGSPAAASLHLARSIARRAEREVVRLSRISRINPEILRYLNRVSDALFMFARSVSMSSKSSEKIWSRKNR